ncbi:hypothetical protein ABK040_013301 [Willaertia magna]
MRLLQSTPFLFLFFTCGLLVCSFGLQLQQEKQEPNVIFVDSMNGDDNKTLVNGRITCNCGIVPELSCKTLLCGLQLSSINNNYDNHNNIPIIKIKSGEYDTETDIIYISNSLILEGIEPNVTIISQINIYKGISFTFQNLIIKSGITISNNDGGYSTVSSHYQFNNVVFKDFVNSIIKYSSTEAKVFSIIEMNNVNIENNNFSYFSSQTGVISVSNPSSEVGGMKLILNQVNIQNLKLAYVFYLTNGVIELRDTIISNVNQHVIYTASGILSVTFDNVQMKDISGKIINDEIQSYSKIIIENSKFKRTNGFKVDGNIFLLRNVSFEDQSNINGGHVLDVKTNNITIISTSFSGIVNAGILKLKTGFVSPGDVNTITIKDTEFINNNLNDYLMDLQTDSFILSNPIVQFENVKIKDNIIMTVLNPTIINIDKVEKCHLTDVTVLNNTITTFTTNNNNNGPKQESVMYVGSGEVYIDNSNIDCSQPTLVNCGGENSDENEECKVFINGKENDDFIRRECIPYDNTTLDLALSISIPIVIYLGFIIIYILLFIYKRYIKSYVKTEEATKLINNYEEKLEKIEAKQKEANDKLNKCQKVWIFLKHYFGQPKDFKKFKCLQFILTPDHSRYTRVAYRSIFSNIWTITVELLTILIVFLVILLTEDKIDIVKDFKKLLQWIPSFIFIISSLSVLIFRGNRIINMLHIFIGTICTAASIVSFHFLLNSFMEVTEYRSCSEREFHKWDVMSTSCVLLILPLWFLPFRITSIVIAFELSQPFDMILKYSEPYLSKFKHDTKIRIFADFLLILIHNVLMPKSCRSKKWTKNTHTMHLAQHFIQFIYEIILTIVAIVTNNYISLLAISVGLFGSLVGVLRFPQLNIICNTFATYLSLIHMIFEVMHFSCSGLSNSLINILMFTVTADIIRISNILHAHLDNREIERYYVYKWFVKKYYYDKKGQEEENIPINATN